MYKVMLIDDERIIAEGIKNIIQRFELGFDQFLICEDGKDALKKFEEFRPDVIFTDIRMSFVDGLELSNRIRARDDALRDIPIVIISGYNEFNYAKKAIANSVFEYLLKPINKQELYEILLKLRVLINDRKEKIQFKKPYLFHEKIMKTIVEENRKDITEELSPLFESCDINIADIKGFYIIGFQSECTEKDDARLMRCFQEVRNYLISSYMEKYILVCFIGVRNEASNDGIASFTNICSPKFITFLKESKVNLFISSCFKEIDFSHKAYTEMQMARNYKKLMVGASIITFDSIKDRNKKASMNIKEIDGILDGINKGDLQAITSQFQAIAEFVDNNKGFSIEYVKCIYSYLCMEVYKRFYSAFLYQKLPEFFEFFLNINHHFDESYSFMDIHAKIREKVLDFSMKYHKDYANDINKKDIITAVKKLIEKDYAQPDFSLNTVAEKLYISSPHLSTLFKKEAGMHFNEYLSRVRIQKSISLLESGKIPVSEIGKLIGYSSEKHFFVVFKKVMGMSPAKYRIKMGILHQ